MSIQPCCIRRIRGPTLIQDQAASHRTPAIWIPPDALVTTPPTHISRGQPCFLMWGWWENCVHLNLMESDVTYLTADGFAKVVSKASRGSWNSCHLRFFFFMCACLYVCGLHTCVCVCACACVRACVCMCVRVTFVWKSENNCQCQLRNAVHLL